MLWWVPRKASELLWRSFETQITLSSILCLCSNAIEYLQLPPTTTVLGLGIILLWGRCPLLQIYLLIDTLISVSVCVCTKKDTHMFLSKRTNQQLIDSFAVAKGAHQEFVTDPWRFTLEELYVGGQSEWPFQVEFNFESCAAAQAQWQPASGPPWAIGQRGGNIGGTAKFIISFPCGTETLFAQMLTAPSDVWQQHSSLNWWVALQSSRPCLH